MKPLLAAIFALLLGCGAQRAQVVAAHALAGAGAALGPELRSLEEAEGHAAIDASAPGGQEAIDAALERVEARWDPALGAVRLLEEAADTWVTALEAQGSGDWGALLGAACRVLAVAAPLAPAQVAGLAGLLKGVCP